MNTFIMKYLKHKYSKHNKAENRIVLGVIHMLRGMTTLTFQCADSISGCASQQQELATRYSD